VISIAEHMDSIRRLDELARIKFWMGFFVGGIITFALLLIVLPFVEKLLK